MRKLTLLLCLVIIGALSLPVLAVDIKGVVVDKKTNAPLPGANVFIRGTTVGAATDINGRFTFSYQASKPFNLTVSYIGYKTQVRTFSPTDDLSNLRFEMVEDVFRGEEIVVTGIASKTAKSVAEVAVARLSANQLTVSNSYQEISQLIAGKVAGVNIAPASGNVGGAIRFNVRSGGGLNGNEQPLIYIDGVRVDNSEVIGFGVGGQGTSTLADLNPEDIEAIDILKGPAGAASYGTSGSNGVVLITTKKGKLVSGAPKAIAIDYKLVTGYNEQSHKYTEDEFISYKHANAIFKKGPVLQHTLNAYGGTGLMKYYLGIDRRYEDGIIPNNYLDRRTLRANFDIYPSNRLIVSVNTSYSLTENRLPNNDNNIFGFLGNTLLTPVPYWFTDSLSVRGLKNVRVANRFIGSIRAQYNPFKNFEASFTLGIDDGDFRNDQTYPANLKYSFYPKGRRAIYNRQNSQYTYNFDARYTYSLFSNLNVSSMVGAQLFDRKLKTFNIQKKDFLTELITNIGAGETFEGGDETYTHTREAGIFTDHSFSLFDQYFFSVMLRNDYASSIGSKAPSIFYPRASLAIRMDKYKFFPSAFDLMKLRVAYGETGVLPGTIDGIPLLWRAEPSGYGAGAVLAAIGNPKIEPERIKELEIGFDAELFTNYSIEFSYYRQFAQNSIIEFRNAPSTGKIATAVPFNIGAVKGWGIESLVQARLLNTRNIQLDLSMTNNYQTNKVTDLGGAQPIFDAFDINVFKEGLPKHAFYTQKVVGALFNADGTYKGPDVLKDENGQEMRVNFGSPIPTYTGSFTMNLRFLKNFSLYVLTDWATGHKMFNNTKEFAIYLGNAFGIGANNKRYRELEDILGIKEWYDNIQTAAVGSEEYKASAVEYAKMDRRYDGNFIEDADYFKLREISFSFSFRDLLSKVNANRYLSDLVIGVSGRNLWTTTKYSGADIEMNFSGARSLERGQDFLTLQNPRVYNLWLRISL